MIEFIHKYPILIKGLLTLVTLAFVLTGGWMMGDSASNYAAKVGDDTIGMKEYEKALGNLQDFYRKAYGGKVPDELEKKMNFPKMTIDNLIDRAVALSAADELGITVTDAEIREAIMDNASFKDKDGKFIGMARYEDLLKYNGMTPAGYERSLRADLTVAKLKKLIRDSVYVTDAEAREYYERQQKAQGKEFDEDDFNARKDELRHTLTGLLQGRAVTSFMNDRKSRCEIEINPAILTGS